MKPSRERTIRETVVVVGAKGEGGRPFSVSSDAVEEDSHQATEKGWDVQRPMEGTVR